MQIAIHTDKDFYLKSMDLSFVFVNENEDSEDSLPEITFSCTVTNIESTTAKKTDTSSYTEVSDLRQIDILEKHLNDFMNAESGSFEQTTTQTVKLGTSVNQTSTEIDTVSFKEDATGFSYEIEAKVESGVETKIYAITYKNGKKITGIKDKENTNQQTASDDLTERQWINSLAAPGDFSASDVCNIEKTENGYLFTLVAPDLSEVESALASLNGSILSCTVTVEVKMSSTELTEYCYTLSVEAKTSQGKYVSTLTATCTYQ